MKIIEKIFKNKWTTIVIFMLVIISIAVTMLIQSMASSVDLAKEIKYVSYASQLKKMVEGANSLGAFDGMVTTSPVCLGTYDEKSGSCWSGGVNVKNETVVDKALSQVGDLPKGQLSPYKLANTRGTILRLNAKSIEMEVYIGDAKRAKVICPQINMIQNPNNELSCVLARPIMKN